MSDWAKMADFYRPQYGQETDELFLAMAKPANKIALMNPFLEKKSLLPLMDGAAAKDIFGLLFYQVPKEQKPYMVDGLMSHYFLDLSSVFPALLLPLEPGMKVLDMCAAPGGKLLVMMSRKISDVTFVANDVSIARSQRLKRVLKEFVPDEYLRRHVLVTTRDGIRFGLKEPSTYDAVLLDAPCSSEAHVVNDKSLLKKFTGLKKSLPMRQYSMLAAALLALKPKGYVLYATCSINKNENDQVIKRILKRKGHLCSLQRIVTPLGDQTEYGISILPHRHKAGPLYFSLLRRL